MKKFIMLSIVTFCFVVFAYSQKTGVTKNIIAPKGSVFNDIPQKQIIPVIEEKENGTINWTEQYIESKGKSFMNFERFTIEGQAEEMAKRGAVVIAQRNLLEIIQGVQVTGITTVKDMVTESDLIITKIEGIIKGAQTIGEPVITKSSVEITMRVPIYDSQKGIAPVLQETLAEKDTDLKNAIRQNIASERRIASLEEMLTEEIPDIVFNLPDGQKISPSMFPKFVDENGKIILDLAEYYNPETGEFPQILQLGKNIFKDSKFKDAVTVIDAVFDKDGNLQIDLSKNEKTKKWVETIKKIGITVGKLLLLFI